MFNQTIIVCSNCNKILLKGDKKYCEENNIHECSECRYHEMNNTRTIENYNKWLKGEQIK